MVRWFGIAALGLVDAQRREVVGGLWEEEQVVDAQAVARGPGAGFIEDLKELSLRTRWNF